MIDIAACNKCNCALLKLESNQNTAPETPHLVPKNYPTLVPMLALRHRSEEWASSSHLSTL
jgi:hypothetical protein